MAFDWLRRRHRYIAFVKSAAYQFQQVRLRNAELMRTEGEQVVILFTSVPLSI